jgi:alkylation response protein AidB-like acyl-CoA dehydrogenase
LAGPTSVVVVLRPGQVEIHDAWHSLGLRGTGSTDFTAREQFVSEKETFILGPWESSGVFSGPLYRFGPWLDTLRIGRVAVGIAQGALDEFLEIAASKVPAYSAGLTADRPTVQERTAKAQALIEAGRNTLRTVVADAWERVEDGPRITGAAGVSLGLAATFALDAAVQAVDLLYQSAGTTAFRDESPLQKRFRDLQTLRQNAITSWSRYESLGKLILGRPSDWAFHNL